MRAAGGGTLVSSAFAGGGDWDALAPYAARIADLDEADLIVVAGERELGDAAGVLELRVRQAVRRGARLLLAGSGGTDLDLVASGRCAPGEVARELRGAARPVLIATDPGAVASAAATARAAGLAGGPGGVLAVPEGPNERGLHALGYTGDAAQVLARAEAGTLQMLIVLGDADVLTRFPEPDRWEAALQRCESVVASSLFPTPTALWAHVILPATSAMEKDGTTTNLEGRTQRLRPFLPPPAGIAPELAVLAAAGRHLELELDESPSRAFARVAGSSPLFAGLSLGVDRPPGPARRQPPAGGHGPGRAGGRRGRDEPRRPARRRPQAALLRCRRRAHRAARIPARRRDRARPQRRAAPRHRPTARPSRCATRAARPPGRRGSRARSRAGAVRFAWDGAPVDGPCDVEVSA